MSGYVIKISQEKENRTIFESAIKSRRLLTGQHFLRGTTAKSGKADRVLYTIHQEKSLLEVCCRVCGQCLWTPCEKPARIPEDAERLQEGIIDLILVKSLSRFRRDAKETITTIRKEIKTNEYWCACETWRDQ